MDEEWNDGVDTFFAEFAENINNNNNKEQSMPTRKLNRLKYEHDQNSNNERSSNAYESVDKEAMVAMARRRIAESVLRNASRKDIQRARQSLPKPKAYASNHQELESAGRNVNNKEVNTKSKNSDSMLLSRENDRNTTMCRKRHKLAQKMERKAARMEERKTQIAKERKAFNKDISGVYTNCKRRNNKGNNACFRK